MWLQEPPLPPLRVTKLIKAGLKQISKLTTKSTLKSA